MKTRISVIVVVSLVVIILATAYFLYSNDSIDGYNVQGNMAVASKSIDGLYNISVINAGVKKTIFSTKEYIDNVDLSRDGKHIAFSMIVNGNWDVFVISVDGGDLVNITNTPHDEKHPSWSYDGLRIAFSSNVNGDWDIYSVGPRGDDLSVILEMKEDQIDPSWSPNDDRMAFVSRDQSGRALSSDILIVNVDNGSVVKLVSGYNPSWSPDGRMIAYISYVQGGRSYVNIIDVDSGSVKEVTAAGSSNSNPVWSPDGAEIAFVTSYEVDSIIDIVSLSYKSKVWQLSDSGVSYFSLSWTSN